MLARICCVIILATELGVNVVVVAAAAIAVTVAVLLASFFLATVQKMPLPSGSG